MVDRASAEMDSPRRRFYFWSRLFGHANHGKKFAIWKGDLEIFLRYVAPGAEESHAGEGGAHFKALETRGFCGALACFENQAADSAARPCWMDEEGTNFGGIMSRIEKSVLAPSPMVAAVECLALAPAAAADGDRMGLCRRGFRFRDKVRLVRDELTINTENALERAFDLTTYQSEPSIVTSPMR